MEIISIVLEVIIILLALWLAFFKSYMTEKGKNIATKEDIKEITEKIESVKYDFLKKSDLTKYERDLNYNLFDALNLLQNELRTINRNSNQTDYKIFRDNFEKYKNEINRLHINYSSTYYSQYKSIGGEFEIIINNYINSSKENNYEKTLININQLIDNIEKYKIEIHKYIKQ